jgi:hypothetical protein
MMVDQDTPGIAAFYDLCHIRRSVKGIIIETENDIRLGEDPFGGLSPSFKQHDVPIALHPLKKVRIVVWDDHLKVFNVGLKKMVKCKGGANGIPIGIMMAGDHYVPGLFEQIPDVFVFKVLQKVLLSNEK